jgi:hypothetical protein
MSSPEGFNNLPDEITLPDADLKTNADGKKYAYEKDGVFYGGDYLPEPPHDVDPTLPQAPEEKNLFL